MSRRIVMKLGHDRIQYSMTEEPIGDIIRRSLDIDCIPADNDRKLSSVRLVFKDAMRLAGLIAVLNIILDDINKED